MVVKRGMPSLGRQEPQKGFTWTRDSKDGAAICHDILKVLARTPFVAGPWLRGSAGQHAMGAQNWPKFDRLSCRGGSSLRRHRRSAALTLPRGRPTVPAWQGGGGAGGPSLVAGATRGSGATLCQEIWSHCTGSHRWIAAEDLRR
jgi:hypothetical protein